MPSNIGTLLTTRLSSRELEVLRSVARQAASLGMPVYVVGGALRDAVLGGPIGDLDLLVEGDALALAASLRSEFGGHVTAHHRFGTAQWALKGATAFGGGDGKAGAPTPTLDHIDLISSRTEKYRATAELPVVAPGGLVDDLARRDFTINTLAVRLDGSHFGEVHDPFGAMRDLERGLIRVLHAGSFGDDPTRLYRAVRYEKRYGFRIEASTLALMRKARPQVRQLSPHRIGRELDLILDEPRYIAMLKRLVRLDLLGPVHPALPRSDDAFRRLRMAERMQRAALDALHVREMRWLVWLIELSPAQLGSLDRRLQFSRERREALIAASAVLRQSSKWRNWSPSRLTVYLDNFPLMGVDAARLALPRSAARSLLTEYITGWRAVHSNVTGRDLRALGLAPGPAYRRILNRLRAAWLDGEIRTVAQERELLARLVRRQERRSVTALHRA